MFALGLASPLVLNKIIILLNEGGGTIHKYIIKEFRGTSLANSSHGGTSVSTLPFIAKIPSTDKNLYLL